MLVMGTETTHTSPMRNVMSVLRLYCGRTTYHQAQTELRKRSCIRTKYSKIVKESRLFVDNVVVKVVSHCRIAPNACMKDTNAPIVWTSADVIWYRT